MTVIVTMLLYIFGLDASTGKLQISSDKDQQSGNLIFSTSNSNTNTTTTSNTTNNTTNNTTTNPNSSVQSSMPDFESSDPQYESFHTLHS